MQWPEAIAEADLYVHPRLGDWCPNMVAEAMACGLPVVAPGFGGVAEMVGDAGILFDWDGWDYRREYVDALRTAVEQAMLSLPILKANGRARAEAALDARKMAESYMVAMGLSQRGTASGSRVTREAR